MITDPAAPAPTRERILDAAVELFGRQGYSRTSVGEIEQAAGLVPRSGALYKHFASKRALLEAALHQRTRAVAEIEQSVNTAMTGDPHAELRLAGEIGLREIGKDQGVLRIVLREGDNFPELRDEFRRRIVGRGHANFADWLRLVARRADSPSADLDALAAVAIGSLISYRLLETLFDEPPGGIDEKRYLDAWTDSTLKLLEAHGLVTDTPKEGP